MHRRFHQAFIRCFPTRPTGGLDRLTPDERGPGRDARALSNTDVADQMIVLITAVW